MQAHALPLHSSPTGQEPDAQVPPQPSSAPHALPVQSAWQAHCPPVHAPLQQSVSFRHTAASARHAQVPVWQVPVQQPRSSWQPPPSAEQPQTPP